MKYGHLTTENKLIYAQNPANINGSLIYNPTKEQYLQISEKEIHDDYPSEPAEYGKHWEGDGYSQTETDIYAKWKQVEDEKYYRTFSKLSIETEFLKAGVLDRFDYFLDNTFIDGTNYALRKFYNTALVLKEDHPMYQSYYNSVKNALGLTDEQLEEILNKSISI